MSLLIKIKYIGFAVLFIVSTVSADDLAYLTIKNNFQVQVVNQIVPNAHSRSENKFLVSLNTSQQQTLQRAGIEFEVFLEDVNISDYSLVFPPDKPTESFLRLEKLGNFIPLVNDLNLTDLTQTTSKATAEQSGYVFRKLDETQIRFSYIPPTVSTYLQLLDFPTDSLADKVSLDSIIAINTRLEGFQTRYIWSDSIIAVRDWIVQKLTDWGYTDITTPSFSWGDGTHYNVMAVKLGYAEPDKVIVIGGHYDSIVYGQPQSPLVFAPGSDDNGSGTTVTLELARILAGVPLRKTIIFMPFSAEEVGLVGSNAAASAFVADSTKIEVMYNFDMVGFTDDSYWDVNLMSGSIDGYVQASKDAAARVTSLIPVDAALRGSSDHWSFYQQGFNICYTAESDFNTLGWHTNLDLTSRMDFPYITDIVRMSAAAIGVVANSAFPTAIESVVDVGDGQSLEIIWSDCNSAYDYVIYYGTAVDALTDSVVVPSGNCSYKVNGLIEGQRYYFSVTGSIPDGYPAVYSVVSNGTPYIVPRTPRNMNANPELNAILVTWQKNNEGDLAGYRVYRNDGSFLELYADNIADTFFVDTNTFSQKKYEYLVTAVDNDLYESNFSNKSSSYPATFDGGILVVDEIAAGGAFPQQDEQVAYFDSIFGGQPYSLIEMNGISDQLQESNLGRYSSMFYFDDDFSIKYIPINETPLTWYTSYNNNMFLSGFRTLSFWMNSNIPQNHFLNQEFGLLSYEEYDPFDFAGAVGENGFPSVQVDSANPLGNLPYILKLQPKSGATVIYRYDSATDDPSVEGEPCGIMYETANGKRVLLAFPLYFLTAESAANIINHVTSLFGETVTLLPGDLDNSGVLNIADLVALVDYFFITNISPLDINTADVDGSCEINISDLVYYVSYLFGAPAGPNPVAGCVR